MVTHSIHCHLRSTLVRATTTVGEMQARCGVRLRSARLQALGRAGTDLISALPDDLLLLILAHLPCVSAAARTGVLSRRWRSLWPRLRQIVFRDVPFRSLEAALGRFPRPPPAVSLLDIRVPIPKEQRADDASVKSLLRAAALLEPDSLDLAWVSFFNGHLTVKSASLQVLNLAGPVLQSLITTIDIETPVLKELNMFFFAPDYISVLAPMLEKVWWRCYFEFKMPVVFDLWLLEQVSLKTAEGQGQLRSLHIHACARLSNFRGGEVDPFTQEIEKHLIVKFSVLELCLTTNGHGFGPLAFHLLGMNRIRHATRRLKITLQRTMVNNAECPFDCPCEPEGWRSNTVSLTALEELEINGFGGDDHELGFLKLMFKCAPMLKKLTVKLSREASSRNDECTELYNIVKACSSVELSVYLSSGLMLGWPNCPSG